MLVALRRPGSEIGKLPSYRKFMLAEKIKDSEIVAVILAHFPQVQAIYMFGSYGTDHEWPQSDVDIALLLPIKDAKTTDFFALGELLAPLQRLFHKKIDLLNLRQVSTVFQFQVIAADRKIYCADPYATDEFEMLTLSFYQKLNEERRAILAEFQQSDRAMKA